MGQCSDNRKEYFVLVLSSERDKGVVYGSIIGMPPAPIVLQYLPLFLGVLGNADAFRTDNVALESTKNTTLLPAILTVKLTVANF